MSDGEEFSASFLGALEGAISVLLTLSVGYYVARAGMVDHKTVKRISALCSNVFLPCLIVVQMGPELTAGNLRKVWILPVWGLISTIIAHSLGWAAQAAFRTRSWVIVAAGRPNTSALPLLLLQSLESTGVLKYLAGDAEAVSKTLHRAKSLILLNVVIQQTITFQIAPSILRRDAGLDGKGRDDAEGGTSRTLTPADPRDHAGGLAPIVQNTERVGLLQDTSGTLYGALGDRDVEDVEYHTALKSIADAPDIDVRWPKSIGILEKPVKRLWATMSPPLIAAIIGLVIGVRNYSSVMNQLFQAYSLDHPCSSRVVLRTRLSSIRISDSDRKESRRAIVRVPFYTEERF